ncbi:hypothetical protein KBC03_03425 [Patescibacteria group bacterium]|nr:hypothetical protein [Patescibacteria group bacterium]
MLDVSKFVIELVDRGVDFDEGFPELEDVFVVGKKTDVDREGGLHIL